MLVDAVLDYARQHLGTEPEYPWPQQYPENRALKHASGKWFGLLMELEYAKVGVDKQGTASVLNLKAEPELIDALVTRPGFTRGYHMNKKHWLSVLLDGTVSEDDVLDLLHGSFLLTGGKG